MLEYQCNIYSEEFIPIMEDLYLSQFEDDIYNALNSNDFMTYMSNEVFKYLNLIAQLELSTISSQEDIETSNYLNSMHVEIIGNDTIRVYNDSVINLDEKVANGTLSQEARERYPMVELSLAKIVEYGIGSLGSTTNVPYSIDWQYNMNQQEHMDKYGFDGWCYKWGNSLVWTKGFQGRLIFLKLVNWVEDNIKSLVITYLIKNLKN